MCQALRTIPGTHQSLNEVGYQLCPFLLHRDAEPMQY